MGMDTGAGTALVVGAGIAGIKAALELAETGYKALLIDSSPGLGGILAELDYQFPTDHCGMCRMLPMIGFEYASQHCLRRSLFHDNIEIMPFTEIHSVQGEAGAFEITLRHKARGVDTDRCNGCGACIDACPIEAADEFNHGLTRRKAIYKPVPHNLPNMLLIDPHACNRCGACVEACPADAIRLENSDSESAVSVHTIILAAGTALFDPAANDDVQAYRASEDVVTALAFERLLSGSGAYDGTVRRPSDGRRARRIAWVQCVGSRNRRQGRDYCSSICCMFALKEAVLARQKGGPDTETTIFYMDMRTYGKDFHRYREAAEKEHGVRLVRCRVDGVTRNADGSLLVRYFDPAEKGFRRGAYDMVVLSTGQFPYDEHKNFAELLGMNLNSGGLLGAPAFEKIALDKPGVFSCGSLMGLTDISEAVTGGIAAAGQASRFMAGLGLPPAAAPALAAGERPADRERPRILLALCRCREKELPGGLDIGAVSSAMEKFPGISAVHVIDSLCATEGGQALDKILAGTRANRLLIGACLPQVYRRPLRAAARRAGFNPALVEVIDLYGGVHRSETPAEAAGWVRSAAAELRAAVRRLREIEPLHLAVHPVKQSALVVGGGAAGLRAALSLSERGISVELVEKSSRLGGRVAEKLHYTVDGLDPAGLIQQLIERARADENITIHLNSEVVATRGRLGAFVTHIRSNAEGGKETEVAHGAAILATGALDAQADEYGYGHSDRILSQTELEQGLAAGSVEPAELEQVVMIQCVGSREPGERDYCSRICCAAALKNAIRLIEANPELRVTILNRDIMTYGFMESHYTAARARGILFVHYDLDHKPEVEVIESRPEVRFTDPVLGMDFEVKPDLLVLAAGIAADPANRKLAGMFRVSLTPDGFFDEADSKWRPVESEQPGVFFAGTAHAPQSVSEALVQAEAAAQKAFSFLCRSEVYSSRVVSRVHHAICARCGLCIETCPYNARALDLLENRIVVDPLACQACGLCAALCRNGAAEVPGWNDRQTMAVIDEKMGAGLAPVTVG